MDYSLIVLINVHCYFSPIVLTDILGNKDSFFLNYDDFCFKFPTVGLEKSSQVISLQTPIQMVYLRILQFLASVSVTKANETSVMPLSIPW